eukprot:g1631.t1
MLKFGPSWFEKTWKELPAPTRAPEDKRIDYKAGDDWSRRNTMAGLIDGVPFGPNRNILEFWNAGKVEKCKMFFHDYPYWIQDNLHNDCEDAVLWVSALWKALMDANNSVMINFANSSGLSRCAIRLLKIGLTNKLWLKLGSNDYMPYYLSSILGSLVVSGNGPSVSNRLLAEGILDVMVPILKGAFTIMEVHLAGRCLAHMTMESTKVSLALIRYPTAIESVANMSSTCFDRFLSHLVVDPGRQMPYHESVITRGQASFKSGRPKLFGRITQLKTSCINVLSHCARASCLVGTHKDAKLMVQPGILDVFIESLFDNVSSHRQATMIMFGRLISSIELNPKLLELVILKYKLHKYLLVSHITPLRTEEQMGSPMLYGVRQTEGMPRLPMGTLPTIYTPTQVWAPAFYCVCSRYPKLHKVLWDDGGMLQMLLPLVFFGQPQFPMPTTSAIGNKDFKLVNDDWTIEKYEYYLPHLFTYAAEAIVRICQNPDVYDNNESARYAVKIAKQMLSSARYFEPLNNVGAGSACWTAKDKHLNPQAKIFAKDRKKKVSKDERKQLVKEFKEQRLESRKEWKLGTELEKKEDYQGAETKYLNALFLAPVVTFGGPTADRATFMTSLARLRCDKLSMKDMNGTERHKWRKTCLWTVSSAIEALGAFNAEILGLDEYMKKGKKRVAQRLELLCRRINLTIEIFCIDLKSSNNWAKRLKHLGKDTRGVADYPKNKEKMNVWSNLIFGFKRKFCQQYLSGRKPLSSMEKDYYDLINKDYQKYFRNIDYVAERTIDGCRNLDPKNVFLILLQSDVEKLFRITFFDDILDNSPTREEEPLKFDRNGIPINISEEDVAENKRLSKSLDARLDKLIEDFIPQLKAIHGGIVPYFSDLAKATSLMLNPYFGSLVHIGENFFCERASFRAFMKNYEEDEGTDVGDLSYYGVGFDTREDRSIHTWARTIYLGHMMSLEELGNATDPVYDDINSDDEEENTSCEFMDPTQAARRDGFRKYGWFEGSQRFDPYFLNFEDTIFDV